MILAIDPGTAKFGLALFNEQQKAIQHFISTRSNLIEALKNLLKKYPIKTFVIGDSAFGKVLLNELSELGLGVKLTLISEKFSTREARNRYWQENQPKGWRRLIPRSLLSPPTPIDNYAALILGERYFKS